MKIYTSKTCSELKAENNKLYQVIPDMEALIRNINHVVSDRTGMEGKAYDSMREYYRSVQMPLAKGVLNMYNKKVAANCRYSEAIQRYLGSQSVVDLEQLQDWKRELDCVAERMSYLTFFSPALNLLLAPILALRIFVQRKIERFEDFLSATEGLYNTCEIVISSVTKGLEMAGRYEFSESEGYTYLPSFNLDWASDAVKDYKANEAYLVGPYKDYLSRHPEDMNKIKVITEYESAHPEDVEKVNKFLDSLDEEDQINIKSIAYSADEPYRSLWVRYLDRYRIVSTTEGGVFKTDNTVRFNIAKDRTNPRGAYYTFFHECGHAVDYYYGLDHGTNDFFSSSFTDSENHTLTDRIKSDVENKINGSIDEILSRDPYSRLSDEEKASIKQNVFNNVVVNRHAADSLSGNSRHVQEDLEDMYDTLLDGPMCNCPSDIYGAVTDNVINGSYGHFPDKDGSYWYNYDGSVKRNPNKEFFAEYYSFKIIEGTKNVDNIEQYLPGAKDFTDNMLSTMN